MALDVRVSAESTADFLNALLHAAEGRSITVNVWVNQQEKEDALADAKLALELRYSGGRSIGRALIQK